MPTLKTPPGAQTVALGTGIQGATKTPSSGENAIPLKAGKQTEEQHNAQTRAASTKGAVTPRLKHPKKGAN